MRHKRVDGLAFAFLLKGHDDRGCKHVPHTIYGGQLCPVRPLAYLCRRHRRLKIGPAVVMVGQQAGRHFADMAHSQRKDQPVQGDAPPVVNRGKQVVGRFCPPALAVLQLLQPAAEPVAKGKNVGRCADPAVFVEDFHLLCPKPFDVKGGAADEMLQAFNGLRRADQTAGAAAHGIARLADGIRSAARTGFWKGVRLGFVRASRQIDIGDFRNDIPGPVNLHPVAYPDVAPAPDRIAARIAASYVILVVQRGVGNDDAPHCHRRQPCHRRKRPGAAHLNVDGFQPGPGQFGGKLMRNRPAGGGRAEPKAALQAKVIHLVDNAIDVIAQRGPLRLDPPVLVQQCLRPIAEMRQRVGLKTQACQPRNCAGLRFSQWR